MGRKSIPPSVQAEILHSNRRRCPICFSYEFDTEIKKGQIAHIDQDSNNNSFENLIFLCLKHHDEYDSKPSQSKGITKEELLKCDKELKEFLSKSFPGSSDLGEKIDQTKIEQKVKDSLERQNDDQSISPELYKIRLPVYYAYREFIWKIIRDAKYEVNDLFKYLDGTHEAPFLYNEYVNSYLELVKEKAIEFRSKQRQLELRYDLKDSERSKLFDEETELLIWLSNTYNVGLKLFTKYLKISS